MKQKKGSILVIVLITFMLVLILGTAFMTQALHSNNYSINKYNNQEAYYAATSAVDAFIYGLEKAQVGGGGAPADINARIQSIVPTVVGGTATGVTTVKDAKGYDWRCDLEVERLTSTTIKITAVSHGIAPNTQHASETISAVLRETPTGSHGLYANQLTFYNSWVNMEDGMVYSDSNVSITNMSGNRLFQLGELVCKETINIGASSCGMDIKKLEAKNIIIDNAAAWPGQIVSISEMIAIQDIEVKNSAGKYKINSITAGQDAKISGNVASAANKGVIGNVVAVRNLGINSNQYYTVSAGHAGVMGSVGSVATNYMTTVSNLRAPSFSVVGGIGGSITTLSSATAPTAPTPSPTPAMGLPAQIDAARYASEAIAGTGWNPIPFSGAIIYTGGTLVNTVAPGELTVVETSTDITITQVGGSGQKKYYIYIDGNTTPGMPIEKSINFVNVGGFAKVMFKGQMLGQNVTATNCTDIYFDFMATDPGLGPVVPGSKKYELVKYE